MPIARGLIVGSLVLSAFLKGFDGGFVFSGGVGQKNRLL